MPRLKKADNRTHEQKQADFLENVALYGNITEAARKSKLDRKTMYRWRSEEPGFAKAWDEAAEIGIEAIEDEARRRAFKGTLKPIYQGGVKVGTVREYSDTLLIFLLKGAKGAKYKERVQHSGDADNPIEHKHEIRSTVIFEDMSEQKTQNSIPKE
ncbi:terminase [Pedobacter zeae]|uniref:Terminase n=1 Tax=Pedobacter zeae TaxID=1737356 RepID=A0A7W6K9J8_9SPHI|nr:terminase [Pedobacter zeae]MBB4107715.1 hypothetical protein [Pedobacter zeae]GGG97530.1 hypothetical protein GCM10007422_09370 [Pedobacter zeae]